EAEAATADAAAARARANAARLRLRAAGAQQQSAVEAAESGTADAAEPSTSGDEEPRISDAGTSTTSGTENPSGSGAGEPKSTQTAVNATEPGNTATTSKTATTGSAADADDVPAPQRPRRLRGPWLPPRPSLSKPALTKRTLAMTAASVVLFAGVASSGFFLWRHHEVTAQQHKQAEYLAAAREGVTTLTSLDFTHAAEDVKRVLDNSTGSFRSDFETRSKDFTSVIQQSKVATKGKVNSAAVQSMSDDSAVVLVAATSEVTNSAGAKQEPRGWRLSVTVQRVDGGLKMSKVEFVP
ncbi:MAG: hypothetical protein J2P18_14245, partial [Nocardia sp.]|nr:hypothetical protein [Nocardia sp.]